MSAKALYFNAGRMEQIADLLSDSLNVASSAVVIDSGGIDLGSNLDITLQGGGEVLGLPSVPSASDAAASKAYVDSVASGLDPKASVRCATVLGISGATYSNGTAGVGATITGGQTVLTIDTVTPDVGDRILVKDQSDPVENGIYTLTTAGVNGSVEFVLTRAVDADSNAEVTSGLFTFVSEGTNGGKGFVLTSPDAIVVGTTDLVFSQFSDAGTFAIDGLSTVAIVATDDYLAIADTSDSDTTKKVLVSDLITTIFGNVPNSSIGVAALAANAIQADSGAVDHLSFPRTAYATVASSADWTPLYVDSANSNKARAMSSISNTTQVGAFVGLCAQSATVADSPVNVFKMNGVLITPTGRITDNASSTFQIIGAPVYIRSTGQFTTRDADIASGEYYIKIGTSVSATEFVSDFSAVPVLKP